MKKTLFLTVVLVLLIAGSALADEGMWLYNRFPADKVKQKYGWAPDQMWLDHLRLSSVRMGASASFVSPDGLVFTNHHVGAGCVHNVSTAEHDYIKDGFYAGARENEPKCPGLEIATLIDIRDITKDVQEAAKPGMSDREVAGAQRAVTAKLEKDCSDAAQNIRCETVTLYAGGMYNLYRYKRYSDVRLVMAPEYDIAFFGGDPDNFTYPRYDLDITFLRVYDNGKPLHVDHYLPMSTTGIKEGDLVFISGHPGTTGRLLTLAQLEYQRDLSHPLRLKTLKRNIADLMKFGENNTENARVVERILFGSQNSYKSLVGQEQALQDKAIMARKAAEEKELRSAVDKDPKMKAEFAPAWEAIAAAVQFQRDNFKRIAFGTAPIGGRIASMARTLVRVASERQKPNDARARGFQDQNLPAIQAGLMSTLPITKDLDILQVTESLQDISDGLGAGDPLVKTMLAGKSPADRARELVNGSKLDEFATRKEIFDGGQAAIDASTDPMIVLLRAVDPEARNIAREVEEKVDNVVRKNSTLIAKARFQVYGEKSAPDATGTLRLSYGVVKGYTENGKKIPYFTTFGGAFDLEAKHGGKSPYVLPKSWHNAKPKLDLSVPLDTVNTGDSVGGNSGSPVVNKNGELVGILFDGNIQTLSWYFTFEEDQARAVLTDSRAVLQSLQKIYNAQPLADEIINAAKAAKK
jgi:hypothetical protein